MLYLHTVLGLGALLATAQFLPAQFYGPRVDLIAGDSSSAVAIADINGDGSPDLVAINFGAANASVFLGDGLGGFSVGTFADTVPFPGSIVLSDLNNDGHLDMVTGSMLDQITVRLGTGQGMFANLTSLQAGGSFAIAVAVSDLNLDGVPDLVTANNAVNTVSVLLGDGSGNFAAKTDFPVGLGPRSVAIADLNGDGRPDLVTANLMGNDVSVLLGDGTGNFASELRFLTGTFPTSVAIGDLDGDGRLDLVTANSYAAARSTVSVLLGDGLGGFGAKTDIYVGNQVQCVAIGDLNGDGIPDLVTANGEGGMSGSVSMLFGDGSGWFGNRTDLPVGHLAYGLAIGDLDADGHPDLVTANANSNTLSVLLNQATEPIGISSYGTGTAGCRGIMGISAASIPQAGNAGFAITFTNASRSSIGFLMLSSTQDLLGTDLSYGLLLHLGMDNLKIFPPIRSDPAGTAYAPLPIPDNPSLIGMKFYAQGLSLNLPGLGQTCSPAHINAQTSMGLEIVVQ